MDTLAASEAAFHRYLDLVRSGHEPRVDEFVAELPAEIQASSRQMIEDYHELQGGLIEEPGVLEAGRVLGDFRLIGELGRGGMAVVWEAEQLSIKRRVALKLLVQVVVPSDDALRRFRREAEAGGRVAHGGIVQVYSVGQAGGVHFIAQELVGDGFTLADRIADARDEPRVPDGYYEETARLFLDVAEAVAHAHERGVVHRDIKPSNILIAPGGRPKIADFGLAKLSDDLGQSRTGELTGTPFYMSPEQAASKRLGIDHRTDVFSVGVTLYEALTLQRPFVGDTVQQVLAQILLSEPPAPRSLRSRVPSDLAVICGKAMEKRPEDRYLSMGELADDLRNHLEDRPILARPPSPLRRAQKWCLRHPTRSALLGLGSAALVVISILLVLNIRARRDAQRSADQILRLSDAKRLQELELRAETLWPASPTRLVEIDAWLDEAQMLALRLDQHRETLAAIGAEAERDGERRFQTTEDAWHHERLAELVEALERLADEETGTLASVRLRRELATALEHATVAGPDVAAAWDAARASIANSGSSPRYGGLRIEPQLGLVPLRQDPESLLWEFWVHGTGTPPEVGEDGRYVLTAESAIVLVLLPGDPDFLLGSEDRTQDPKQRTCRVNLVPFFAGKFEVTQGQWERVFGSNPSGLTGDRYQGFDFDGSHPVERVTWHESERLCARFGLQLPTEAQWEYACRGGRRTRFWFGGDPADAEGRENLRDESNARESGLRLEPWDDGFPFHAPVGSFAPNPHGLFDMHGNVSEWCADWGAGDYGPDRLDPGDGLSPSVGDQRVKRGGSWHGDNASAHSAFRHVGEPTSSNYAHGLRVARALDV
ncbi:MAG: bifunctional serine/threonine-protein kinase/formylglycine-generating enzyme family protein [Planctomycetota bacterium]